LLYNLDWFLKAPIVNDRIDFILFRGFCKSKRGRINQHCHQPGRNTPRNPSIPGGDEGRRKE
jgi:hypothetical protein